jgi:hypothetical protein
MDILYLGLLFLSIGTCIFGIAQFIGLGWALFIFDLLTHASVHNYAADQREYPGAKTAKQKRIGLLLVVSSSFLIWYILFFL